MNSPSVSRILSLSVITLVFVSSPRYAVCALEFFFPSKFNLRHDMDKPDLLRMRNPGFKNIIYNRIYIKNRAISTAPFAVRGSLKESRA